MQRYAVNKTQVSRTKLFNICFNIQWIKQELNIETPKLYAIKWAN